MDDTTDFAQTCVGTPYYLSPEVIEGRPYNHLSDVWALGVVLYQMVAFRYPFEAPTLPALALRIVSGDWSPPPNGVSDDLVQLISTLLAKEHSARPDMEQVLDLPVVSSRITRFENEMRRLWHSPRSQSSSQSSSAPPQRESVTAEHGGAAASVTADASSVDAAPAAPAPAAAAAAVALPATYAAASWPLEPTALEVSAAERELVAAAFAEAGEPLLCLCAVQKVQDRTKRGERLLGVGTHRLLVLSPKRCARRPARDGPRAPPFPKP
jgi:hypothetical protein